MWGEYTMDIKVTASDGTRLQDLSTEDDINYRDDCGQTLLQKSLKNNADVMFQDLLARGADVNLGTGFPPLHLAVVTGKYAALEKLVHHPCIDVNRVAEDGRNALQLAVLHDDARSVAILTEVGLEKFSRQLQILQKALIADEAAVCKVFVHRVLDGKSSAQKERALGIIMNHGSVDSVRTLITHPKAVARAVCKSKFSLGMYNDSNKETLLHIAARSNSSAVDVCDLLLNHGAEADIADSNGVYPCHIAAENRDAELAQVLIKHGCDLNVKTGEGETALTLAVMSDTYTADSDILRTLIEGGADADLRNTKDGNNALHLSASHGNESHYCCLVEHTKDVNCRNMAGQTPLHKVLQRSSVSVPLAKCLVEKGADVNALDNAGVSVLVQSIRSENKEVIKYILSQGPTLDYMDNDGKTALHVAAQKLMSVVMGCLVEAGADCTLRDDRGNTPLHLALCVRSDTKFRSTPLMTVDLLHQFIEAGAPLSDPNSLGRTPVFNAVTMKNMKCAERLLEHGASVNVPEKIRNTPLHIVATVIPDNYILDFVLAGADLRAVCSKGLTPLMCNHTFTSGNKDHPTVQDSMRMIQYGADINSTLDPEVLSSLRPLREALGVRSDVKNSFLLHEILKTFENGAPEIYVLKFQWLCVCLVKMNVCVRQPALLHLDDALVTRIKDALGMTLFEELLMLNTQPQPLRYICRDVVRTEVIRCKQDVGHTTLLDLIQALPLPPALVRDVGMCEVEEMFEEDRVQHLLSEDGITL